MTLGHVTFGLGNAVGLLISGILLGFLRANHPTFGYVPQSAINFSKDLGLMLFMVSIGLNAGQHMLHYLSKFGIEIIIYSLVVSVVPVLLAYFIGTKILKMNPALLLGALIGARTCAPAMDIVSDYTKSTIPALGYAGTYPIANILMTISGTILMLLT